jgi:hypothetical protein
VSLIASRSLPVDLWVDRAHRVVETGTFIVFGSALGAVVLFARAWGVVAGAAERRRRSEPAPTPPAPRVASLRVTPPSVPASRARGSSSSMLN